MDEGLYFMTISRWDFLRLMYIGVASTFLDGCGFLKADDKRFLENVGVEQNESGIEIWGIGEPIRSDNDLNRLYNFFDERFTDRLTEEDKLLSRREQREKILDKNVRYAEIGVRKSDYNKIQKSLSLKGLTFAQWVKIDIEIANLAMNQSKPSSGVALELSRIVILDDWYFGDSYSRLHSVDIDGAYKINDEYDIDKPGANQIQYSHNDGKIEFSRLDGNLIVAYPDQNDDKIPALHDGVGFDFGISHELSHVVMNLPDEYIFNVENADFKFNNFIMSTGFFHEPVFSPYLSYLTKFHNRIGIRGSNIDYGGYSGQPDLTNFDLNVIPSLVTIKNNLGVESSAKIPTLSYQETEKSYLGIYQIYYNNPDFVQSTEVASVDTTLILSDADLRKVNPDGSMYPLDTIAVINS